MDRDIARRALDGIASDARKARVLDRIPKSAHPTGFMISIGLMPPGAELEEEEAEHDEEIRDLAGLDDDEDALDLDV